jgi:hypothetical protein
MLISWFTSMINQIFDQLKIAGIEFPKFYLTHQLRELTNQQKPDIVHLSANKTAGNSNHLMSPVNTVLVCARLPDARAHPRGLWLPSRPLL